MGRLAFAHLQFPLSETPHRHPCVAILQGQADGSENAAEGYPANPKSLGEHVKKRRMDLGLKQAEVAGLVGVDKWTVLNWERGKTEPVVRYYSAILAFLGYNPLPVGETFQERLKAARQARGLSWKRLAEELGCGRQQSGTGRTGPVGRRRRSDAS